MAPTQAGGMPPGGTTAMPAGHVGTTGGPGGWKQWWNFADRELGGGSETGTDKPCLSGTGEPHSCTIL